MANYKKFDWKKIERLYRAGLLSISEIAREAGTVPSNIRHRAKKEGWKRDLTQEVRNSARTMFVENLAKKAMGLGLGDDLKSMADEQIVQEAARTQVEVVRQHQKTLHQGHSLVMRMLEELDVSTSHHGDLTKLIAETVAPLRQEALRRAISLGSRATVMRDLATAARTWVTLERQAFNIVEEKGGSQEGREIDKMSAEELRAEILKDAKKIGLDLTEEDIDKQVSNGKMH